MIYVVSCALSHRTVVCGALTRPATTLCPLLRLGRGARGKGYGYALSAFITLAR